MPITSLLHLADPGVSHDCFHRLVVINDIIDVTIDSFGMLEMGGDRPSLTTATACHGKRLHTRIKTRLEETMVRQSYGDRGLTAPTQSNVKISVCDVNKLRYFITTIVSACVGIARLDGMNGTLRSMDRRSKRLLASWAIRLARQM